MVGVTKVIHSKMLSRTWTVHLHRQYSIWVISGSNCIYFKLDLVPSQLLSTEEYKIIYI